MKQTLFIIFSLFIVSSAFSQMGGQGVYQFLYLTNAPRVASLGGNNVSIFENDPALAYQNPALLVDSMDKHFALNYVNYFTDINYGYVGYAFHMHNKGDASIGIQHINYGKFDQADEAGTITGKFYASEYAFNLIYSHAFKDSSFRAGINIKPVLSVFEHYKSFGIVADAGLSYYSSKRNFGAGFVLKNFGSQIRPYVEGNVEPVDFDLQFGITKKLKHAPLRISITAQHLENWNLVYTNPTESDNQTDLISGETKKKSYVSRKSDEIMRHIIIGTEITLTRSFYFALGYNYQRRKDMLVETRPFMVGTSWGFGFRISKFHISYARACYHLAGASNLFSISTDLGAFYKKAQL
jgi:hypothetical protein